MVFCSLKSTTFSESRFCIKNSRKNFRQKTSTTFDSFFCYKRYMKTNEMSSNTYQTSMVECASSLKRICQDIVILALFLLRSSYLYKYLSHYFFDIIVKRFRVGWNANVFYDFTWICRNLCVDCADIYAVTRLLGGCILILLTYFVKVHLNNFFSTRLILIPSSISNGDAKTNCQEVFFR